MWWWKSQQMKRWCSIINDQCFKIKWSRHHKGWRRTERTENKIPFDCDGWSMKKYHSHIEMCFDFVMFSNQNCNWTRRKWTNSPACSITTVNQRHVRYLFKSKVKKWSFTEDGDEHFVFLQSDPIRFQSVNTKIFLEKNRNDKMFLLTSLCSSPWTHVYPLYFVTILSSMRIKRSKNEYFYWIDSATFDVKNFNIERFISNRLRLGRFEVKNHQEKFRLDREVQ
jgi:hypothetical protein